MICEIWNAKLLSIGPNLKITLKFMSKKVTGTYLSGSGLDVLLMYY
jgi:hypothetical protein